MANEMNSRDPRLGFRKPKFNIFWVYGIIAMLILGWSLMSGGSVPQETNWDAVQKMIAQGEVKKVVVVNQDYAEVFLTPAAYDTYSKEKEYKNIPKEGPQLTFNIGSLEYFQNSYDAVVAESGNAVPLTFDKRKSMWTDMLVSLLPFALIILVWILIMRNMSRGGGANSGVFNVGKAKAQVFDKDASTKVTFKDVAGLEEAKVEIMEIVDFLKNPQKYKDLGGKIPKGALLVGPPGTGKTLLAKAVAGEANVPFFSISGSDFVEMFVGVGASRVRDLFRQAKEKAPCIVFIDEIDAIGRARGKNAGFSSNDERENTLNQLLTEMDGFGTNAGVIVLAATNRVDILDKALMRAGRFDRQIEVGLPDLHEREEIFNVHLRNLKLSPDLDRSFLARQTPGFSGADIANVCNEAALIAARHDKKAVDKEDFLAAIDRIIGGLERKNKIITQDEKRTIAFHEAGHATVSWMLKYANPLIKVTIIPRGKALGAAWYLPDERQITTREQMMDEMAAILGGRVSEELNFGRISTGALNDLERVTKMAYAMVAYYGMSDKVGNMSYYDSSGQSDMAFTKPYSEQTARQIDAEVKAIIAEAYAMAREVLVTHTEGLHKLAEMLLEREVIFAEDLERIFGPRPKGRQDELAEENAAIREAEAVAREAREAAAQAEAGASRPAGEADPQPGAAAATADPGVSTPEAPATGREDKPTPAAGQ
ncbi:MAG: ATP-dependent zinc metalloprotease FtsH [Rikenellaceae bacterium]|nr:ATP-dependent zinc metalloprotease FtsH [Rikenellaceae bacterium]